MSFKRNLQFILVLCLLLFNLHSFAQTPASNPNLVPACPMDILFIMDESGSIAGFGSGTSDVSASVRNAASGVLNSLVGTNSRVAIIEFNTRARRAPVNGSIAYQTVNASTITHFLNYVNDNNTAPEDNHYDPEDYLGNTQNAFTNWEDALIKAQAVNGEAVAQLVLFFTDGVPTAYINSSGSVTQGSTDAVKLTSLNEAIGAANAVKAQGSHIFVIGLPNAVLPEGNVQKISGTDRYPDQQPNFTIGDYSISSSQTLQADLTRIGTFICRADLRLSKTLGAQSACTGGTVTFTLTVTNDGLIDATGVVVKDFLPGGFTYVSNNGGATNTAGTVTWNAGSVNYLQSKSLQITATVNTSGSYKNVAEVTASNQPDGDSSPNNGVTTEDDYATVTLTSILNCDDANPCTIDGCTNGVCTHTGGNCDDNEACTDDACVNGQCVNTARDCNDNNACTSDFCANGNCAHPQINCNDPDPCTIDGCSGGICTHTPFVCDDGNPCTNDVCAGVSCRYFPINCNDGNPCTVDVCNNGTCSNTPKNCNDADVCTNDGCVNNVCFNNVIPGCFDPCDTLVCNDGDSCTIDACVNGNCIYTPLDCSDGNPNTIDACFHGVCTHTCNDNNPCTIDTVINGVCTTLPLCNDNDACTLNSCVNGVCTYTPIDCNDNNPNTDDECVNGQCTHTCDDNNPCTSDVLQNGDCVFTQKPCNDNNACTTDACVNGSCVFTPVNCDDGNPQSTDLCVGGTCTHTCDDSNACTNDTYQNGQCIFTTIPCNDNNACTTDGCQNGNCVYTPKNCDDGNPQTTDVCVNGECQNTTCNDNNPCTIDVLVSGGCVFNPIICNDNDGCTDDACVNGACVYTPKVCNDGNPCTIDFCVNNGGCIYDPLNCDDGNPQTSDACVNGECVHTPIDCDDAAPLKILFIMDESGSIAGFGANTSNISPQVRAAATGAIHALEGTNTLVSIVEFNTASRRAVINGTTAFQPISAASSVHFLNYLNDANNLPTNTNYDPEDYLGVQANTFTNWEDALEDAQLINASEGPVPLIVFFTDGFATAYNNANGVAVTGSGVAHEAQALAEAAAAANIVKAQGSHIFVVGVPNPMLPESKVHQISGTDRYPDIQPNFIEADYSISTSQSLEADLTQIGALLCRADLRLTKTVDKPVACPGSTVVFTVTLMNQGLENTSNVQVRDILPSGFTYVSDDGGAATTEAGGVVLWTVGSILNAQTKTLKITAIVNETGNHKNTAQVIASDILDGDSTPNNDDGDQSEDDEDAVTVDVNCDCNLKISNLMLMWECTLGEIGPLTEGKVINRDTVCRFNIRADVCQMPVGSVKFVMNGVAKVESTAPFAYFGDQPAGCYKPWIPAPGNYTLVVTAYSGAGATGTAGTPVTVHFTVVAGQNGTAACTAAPLLDCTGKPNGTAFRDDCGVCSGGTSGHVANSDKDNCGVCFGNGSTCCTTDGQCNDNNACTSNSCVSGNCVFTPANANDNDACTTDGCNTTTGDITHTAVNCNDNNACTTDGCDPQTGCTNTGSPSCCQSAGDCNDNDPCTVDACTGGTCQYSAGGSSQPAYLKLVNTTSNYQKIRLAYSSSNFFLPKVNVTTGGNNQMCITLRDPLGTAQWNKIRIRPQGSSTSYITLSSYVPANPGTDWFTVCIPLSAFGSFNFTQISYLEFANNGAAAFQINVQRIQFTGGSTPFTFFGDSKTDNLFDPVSGALSASLVAGQPCGTPKLLNENAADQLVANEEEAALYAYPNPFRDAVTITFSTPVSERVKLEIVSIDGRRVAKLFDGDSEKNVPQQAEFRNNGLANGMYFYRLTTASGKTYNRKLLLMGN